MIFDFANYINEREEMQLKADYAVVESSGNSFKLKLSDVKISAKLAETEKASKTFANPKKVFCASEE